MLKLLNDRARDGAREAIQQALRNAPIEFTDGTTMGSPLAARAALLREIAMQALEMAFDIRAADWLDEDEEGEEEQ